MQARSIRRFLLKEVLLIKCKVLKIFFTALRLLTKKTKKTTNQVFFSNSTNSEILKAFEDKRRETGGGEKRGKSL